METVDDVLEHYGVKGMRWGVRKKAPAVKTKVELDATPGRRVKAKGGTGQPIAKDAKVAAVSRQKAKKSTVDALSNDELKSLVTRMNLEQQYSQLETNRRSRDANPAIKFVGKTLTAFGEKQAGEIITQEASKLVDLAMKKN